MPVISDLRISIEIVTHDCMILMSRLVVDVNKRQHFNLKSKFTFLF